MTREDWLTHFIDHLRPLFVAAQHPLPKDIRVSVGWPSKRGLPSKEGKPRTIGECWHKGMEDGIPQIFISPMSEVETVCHVLVHELCHAVTPGAQHKGPFITAIRIIGLEGKPTSTHAGENLKAKLAEIVTKIGEYPHVVLTPKMEHKDVGRMLKIVCQCEAPRILRLSKKVIEQGPIECGLCGEEFLEPGAV